MRPRFSILTLMEVTAVVAFVVAMDRVVLGAGPTFFTIGFPAIGGAAGAYLGIRLRPGNTFEQIVKSARLWAAVVSMVNGLIVGVIIAEAFRGMNYFDWSQDWFRFVISVAIVVLVSTGVGMFLAMGAAAYIASRQPTAGPK